jgi:hypothetical protein
MIYSVDSDVLGRATFVLKVMTKWVSRDRFFKKSDSTPQASLMAVTKPTPSEKYSLTEVEKIKQD